MRQNFPEVDASSANWVVVADEQGLRSDVFRDLLAKHVVGEDLLIEVHRRIGGLVPRQEAEAYVSMHFGQGDIRISNREFTGFVVVTLNGVATAWAAPTHDL